MDNVCINLGTQNTSVIHVSGSEDRQSLSQNMTKCDKGGGGKKSILGVIFIFAPNRDTPKYISE